MISRSLVFSIKEFNVCDEHDNLLEIPIYCYLKSAGIMLHFLDELRYVDICTHKIQTAVNFMPNNGKLLQPRTQKVNPVL